MPEGDFSWNPKEQYAKIDWSQLGDNDPHGYIIECDLDYPAELHDRHNQYPLAPERFTIGRERLSGKQLE